MSARTPLSALSFPPYPSHQSRFGEDDSKEAVPKDLRPLTASLIQRQFLPNDWKQEEANQPILNQLERIASAVLGSQAFQQARESFKHNYYGSSPFTYQELKIPYAEELDSLVKVLAPGSTVDDLAREGAKLTEKGYLETAFWVANKLQEKETDEGREASGRNYEDSDFMRRAVLVTDIACAHFQRGDIEKGKALLDNARTQMNSDAAKYNRHDISYDRYMAGRGPDVFPPLIQQGQVDLVLAIWRQRIQAGCSMRYLSEAIAGIIQDYPSGFTKCVEFIETLPSWDQLDLTAVVYQLIRTGDVSKARHVLTKMGEDRQGRFFSNCLPHWTPENQACLNQLAAEFAHQSEASETSTSSSAVARPLAPTGSGEPGSPLRASPQLSAPLSRMDCGKSLVSTLWHNSFIYRLFSVFTLGLIPLFTFLFGGLFRLSGVPTSR